MLHPRLQKWLKEKEDHEYRQITELYRHMDTGMNFNDFLNELYEIEHETR